MISPRLIRLLALQCVSPGGPHRLRNIEAALADDFAEIDHVPPGALEARLAAGRALVLVDARSAMEFAVGRLTGAVRIDPNADAAAAAARLGGHLGGAEIVIYCSVGLRSSILARRVAAAFQAAGALSIANLRGGVFAWANSGRAMENDSGQTRCVHPFDRRWAGLLAPEICRARKPD